MKLNRFTTSLVALTAAALFAVLPSVNAQATKPVTKPKATKLPECGSGTARERLLAAGENFVEWVISRFVIWNLLNDMYGSGFPF